MLTRVQAEMDDGGAMPRHLARWLRVLGWALTGFGALCAVGALAGEAWIVWHWVATERASPLERLLLPTLVMGALGVIGGVLAREGRKLLVDGERAAADRG
jgi:hypothetical protein